MDVLGFFLDQHARFHAADVGGGAPASFSDRVLGGLDVKTLRARPLPSVNSIAWLVWHMARVEDVVVNLVIVAGAQVLDDSWIRRLAVDRRDIGTAMTSDEVGALSARIDLDALAAYRSAVGRRTREVVRALAPSAWDEEIVEADTARAAAVGAFAPEAEWVPGFWRKQTRSTRLGAMCTHNAMHVGEAVTLRGLAGEGTGL